MTLQGKYLESIVIIKIKLRMVGLMRRKDKLAEAKKFKKVMLQRMFV